MKITHPFLCVASAPKVKYQQEEGTDLCAFKSLASVLHVLGWERETEQLDSCGAAFGKGSTSGFDHLKQVSVALLPGWLQIRRLPKGFSDTDVTPKMVAVLVLKASDGNCSHAVTTHGGFLYDANEEAAIPFARMHLTTAAAPRKFIPRLLVLHADGSLITMARCLQELFQCLNQISNIRKRTTACHDDGPKNHVELTSGLATT